jgi:hypothetical protein
VQRRESEPEQTEECPMVRKKQLGTEYLGLRRVRKIAI